MKMYVELRCEVTNNFAYGKLKIAHCPSLSIGFANTEYPCYVVVNFISYV